MPSSDLTAQTNTSSKLRQNLPRKRPRTGELREPDLEPGSLEEKNEDVAVKIEDRSRKTKNLVDEDAGKLVRVMRFGPEAFSICCSAKGLPGDALSPHSDGQFRGR